MKSRGSGPGIGPRSSHAPRARTLLRVEWLSSDPEDVVTFVERFAASRPDNLDKLRNSGAAERHLFVWGRNLPGGLGVTATAQARRSCTALASTEPATGDHVWVAADGECPSRIVHWTPHGGWQEAGRIE